MMDRPCENMQERIADYVLGALDEREAKVVRSHVDGCEACEGYMRTLSEHGEALAALGEQILGEMTAREDKVIEALEALPAPAGEPGWVLPWMGRLLRTAVAAVLVLGVGIAIGRLTASEPINIEQLRADLERTVAASLRPAVRESVLTEADRRLQAGLSNGQERMLAKVDERLQAAMTDGQAVLSATLTAQVRQELRTFGTQFMAGSEAMMERRLDDFMRLIEAARLKDRQRVARALEQIELNRMRDARQLGLGLRTLAIQTANETTTMEN